MPPLANLPQPRFSFWLFWHHDLRRIRSKYSVNLHILDVTVLELLKDPITRLHPCTPAPLNGPLQLPLPKFSWASNSLNRLEVTVCLFQCFCWPPLFACFRPIYVFTHLLTPWTVCVKRGSGNRPYDYWTVKSLMVDTGIRICVWAHRFTKHHCPNVLL